MARSREKAQLMFNRWTSIREDASRPAAGTRRPYLASEVKSLPEADKWRRELLREVGAKVAEIQNAGLGEARLRELNDEINKLLREKGHWERQIRALGGADYARTAPRAFDAEGREVTGSGGYRYFGAARELPGVRELFATEGAGRKRPRTRGEIARAITPDYYGYRDEEDGTLLRAEAAAQAAAAAAAAGAAGAAAQEAAPYDDDDAAAGFAAHVPLPPQAAIDAAVLERKRQLLLAKYVGGDAARRAAAAAAASAAGAAAAVAGNS